MARGCCSVSGKHQRKGGSLYGYSFDQHKGRQRSNGAWYETGECVHMSHVITPYQGFDEEASKQK